MHGKFQLHRFVELRVEPDVAHVAMRGLRQLGERRRARQARGTAIRAQHLPAQVQQPGARGVQKNFQDFPAIRLPAFRDVERPDVRQLHVRRRHQQVAQLFQQRRRNFFGAQFTQATVERREVGRCARQVGHHRRLLAGQMFADVTDEHLKIAHGFWTDDVADQRGAEKISGLEMAEGFDGATGFGFAQAQAHHRLSQRARRKDPAHLIKLRLRPFKRKFPPRQRQAEHFGAGGDFASAFRQRFDGIFDRRQADGAIKPVGARQNRPHHRARMR